MSLSTLSEFSYAVAMPMEADRFGSSSTFLTTVFLVTVVIGGWVPIFKVFYVFHIIDFVLGSKRISSRHAMSYCLDEVNGTNPISTIGRCPLVSMLLNVDGGFSRLS